MPVAVATGIVFCAPVAARRQSNDRGLLSFHRQGREVYGGPEEQGGSEPPPVLLPPGPCGPLLPGLLAVARLPPAVSPIVPLGPAPAMVPAAPSVELPCAQAINDVPARNAAATAVRRTVCDIILFSVERGCRRALDPAVSSIIDEQTLHVARLSNH